MKPTLTQRTRRPQPVSGSNDLRWTKRLRSLWFPSTQVSANTTKPTRHWSLQVSQTTPARPSRSQKPLSGTTGAQNQGLLRLSTRWLEIWPHPNIQSRTAPLPRQQDPKCPNSSRRTWGKVMPRCLESPHRNRRPTHSEPWLLVCFSSWKNSSKTLVPNKSQP
jgi:hypothetical protein